MINNITKQNEQTNNKHTKYALKRKQHQPYQKNKNDKGLLCHPLHHQAGMSMFNFHISVQSVHSSGVNPYWTMLPSVSCTAGPLLPHGQSYSMSHNFSTSLFQILCVCRLYNRLLYIIKTIVLLRKQTSRRLSKGTLAAST